MGFVFFFNYLELIILVVIVYYFVIVVIVLGVWGEEKGKYVGNDGKIKEEESFLKFFIFFVVFFVYFFLFII